MLKKLMSIFVIMFLLLSFLGCNNGSNDFLDVINLQVENPTFTYGTSREITKDEVSLFLEDYKDELNEAIEPCDLYSIIDDDEVSYEEAKDIDQSLCGPTYSFNDAFQLDNNLLSLEDMILNLVFENDSIMSSTDIVISSSRGSLNLNDEALKYIIYNNETSRFTQITLAIIDGEVYFEELTCSKSQSLNGEEDTINYRHYIYYENHYQIYDKLYDTTGREHLKMDLKTSHFYYYNKVIDYPMTILYFGDDEVINTITHTGGENEFVTVHTTLYKDNLFSMNYSMVAKAEEDHPSMIMISAFELSGWDELRGGPSQFYTYNDDEIVYPEYTFEMASGFFPALVIDGYELNDNSLIIEGTNIDLSVLKNHIDDLSHHYVDILNDFNIDLDLVSYDAYVSDFEFIDEIASDYIG